MRNPLFPRPCLAILLSLGLPLGLPAQAQPSPAVQPVGLGVPAMEPEKSSIGFVDVPSTDCRPVYAAAIQEVGPPMAEPEKRTQGRVVAGFVCDARR